MLSQQVQKLYDYLNDNPECMSAPVDYTNSIATISSIDNFISINNAVDVDLYGQISAESSGIRQISGAGGQLDFVMGAYLSKGGKSFVCLSSTFTNKKGKHSQESFLHYIMDLSLQILVQMLITSLQNMVWQT